MFGFFKKNDPREELQNLFEGKILVEPLKTKINRHKVFWVGRSKHDSSILRIGIEFSNARRYFFDWDDFQEDARLSSYDLMTPEEADRLEEKIKQQRAKKS